MTISSGVPPRTRFVRPAHSSSDDLSHPTLDIAVIGLSITSSWGNDHAAAFRSLVKELSRRGHRVHFYERDVPWYAMNRDLPAPPHCHLHLYDTFADLSTTHAQRIQYSDAVIIGSSVPNGGAVAEWVISNARGAVAFYDLDTPATLSKLERGDYEYISPEVISEFDMYLSSTGGPTLTRLESEYGARQAVPLFASVDTDEYYPLPVPLVYDLGYMGTYSKDLQPGLDLRLIEPARRWRGGRFAVAGQGYPESFQWPENVERVDHLPPSMRRRFYNSQRFTLNITRQDAIAAGYGPSVRLFEAAACGTPIISDRRPGLEAFFEPGKEVLVADSPADTLKYLQTIDDEDAVEIGRAARRRVLSSHTTAHRAAELEGYLIAAVANVPAQP